MSTATRTSTPFAIRDFVPSDQPQVVALLRRVLDRPGPHVHDDAYFRWKHLENPFGSSIMYVAESDRRVIGFRAIMRWRLEAGGRIVEAGRPVDTVTDPSCRRQGVFSSLTKTALGRLEQLGITVLFNTPNEQSLPGYLKMGWTPIGRATRDVLVGGPGILARVVLARRHRNGTSRSASSGASPDASDSWGRVTAALHQRRVPGARVVKDHAYVLWRYTQHPWFRYRVVHHGDAAAVVRVAKGHRLKMAIIAESTVVRPQDWQDLLVPVATQTGCLIVQFVHTQPDEGPGRAGGWLHLVRPGPMIVARSEQRQALDPGAWALTTGELEFF